MATCVTEPARAGITLARLLLVDDEPASRLALKTVLQAGGYDVDTAASAAEAVRKLDDNQYEIVLTDLHMEYPEAGLRVLAHARIVSYQPATALINTSMEQVRAGSAYSGDLILISSDDVPELLTVVADLVGARASRRLARSMRNA